MYTCVTGGSESLLVLFWFVNLVRKNVFRLSPHPKTFGVCSFAYESQHDYRGRLDMILCYEHSDMCRRTRCPFLAIFRVTNKSTSPRFEWVSVKTRLEPPYTGTMLKVQEGRQTARNRAVFITQRLTVWKEMTLGRLHFTCKTLGLCGLVWMTFGVRSQTRYTKIKNCKCVQHKFMSDNSTVVV